MLQAALLPNDTRFETADARYAFLNRIVAVATGDRRKDGPIYTIHEVV